MISGLFHIKVNGDDTNKDNAMKTLVMSGSSIFCLDGEEYVINDIAMLKLKEKDIDFDVLRTKGVMGECDGSVS